MLSFIHFFQELAITSDEALSLDDVPKHAVVLGGGYISSTSHFELIIYKN